MPAKPFRRPRVWILLAGMPLCLAAGFAAARLTETPDSVENRETVSKPVSGAVEIRQVSQAGAVKEAEDGGVFQNEREWIRRLQAATTEELPALWSELSLLSDTHERQALWDLLYQKWVAVDPAGCMAFKKAPDQEAKVMAAWLRRDADRAIAWAMEDGDVSYRLRLMFSQLAKIDPARFLSLAAGADEEQLPDGAVQTAFRKLAKQDPAAACEALSRLGPKARGEGSWALGREWARTNPQAALAWAKSLTEPAERQSALRGVLASLARTDPEAAIASMELLEDVQDTAGEDPKTAIVSGLADKDPRKAFDFVMERFSDQNDRLRLLSGTVLRKLGALLKPAELAALLDRTGIVRSGAEGGMSSSILFADGRSFVTDGFDLNLVLYSGGEVLPELPDPAAAFREILGPDMTPAAKFTADQIARQWVEKDARGAIQAFENTPEGPLRDMLTSALLSHAYTNTDLNLLAKLEKEDAARIQDIGEMIISEAVRSDFVKVLDWAEKLPEGTMQTKAHTAALGAWTGFDPAGALAWADRRPEEDQPPLYHAISDAQAKSDSYGNSEWVASLPVGHQRDAAATALIENLASKDPHSALEWAKSINNAGTQAEAMKNLFTEWTRRDPAAAWQAFQPLELRPGEKELLEQHLQPFIKR